MRKGRLQAKKLYAATRPYAASVLSQKFADKPFALPMTLPQPRQGRKIVAQGVSPGCATLTPSAAADTPLPPERERGRG
jgi:hypothetical protein